MLLNILWKETDNLSYVFSLQIILLQKEPYTRSMQFTSTSPWACHLAVVVELVCLNDPKSYAGGDLVPGGFNRAGLVEG